MEPNFGPASIVARHRQANQANNDHRETEDLNMNQAAFPKALLRDLSVAVLLLAVATSTVAEQQQSLKLIGTGASFPAPLYLRWFRDYYLAHPEVEIDYQSTSTSGGVKDLIGGRVQFAGSDLPLTDEQAAEVPGGIRQVPMAAGGIVAIYNLPGVQGLKLSREALVGVFSGSITRWTDPAIATANPEASLPDTPIVVVTRADAGGTTYKFTRHLSALSSEFARQVGTSLSPNWPQALKERGGLVRGRGNGGVAASVRVIPGSIGYVQYAFGFLPGISMAALENRSGKIVDPGEDGFRAALRAVSENNTIENAADPAGEASYPIVGLSWLVMRREYDDPAIFAALKDLIEYAIGKGQDVTETLGYVRFPELVIAYVREQLQ
jgi:phosphate transport system substrate-binding protein